MKIIRRIADNVVLYLFADTDAVQITEAGLTGPVTALDILPETHELITSVAMPEKFWGGLLSYNGSWVVLDQEALDRATAIAPEPVPEWVTRRQAKQYLLSINMLTTVNTTIEGLPEPQRTDTLIDWNDADEIRRDWPSLIGMAHMLGWNGDDLDTMFREAAKL